MSDGECPSGVCGGDGESRPSIGMRGTCARSRFFSLLMVTCAGPPLVRIAWGHGIPSSRLRAREVATDVAGRIDPA